MRGGRGPSSSPSPADVAFIPQQGRSRLATVRGAGSEEKHVKPSDAGKAPMASGLLLRDPVAPSQQPHTASLRAPSTAEVG